MRVAIVHNFHSEDVPSGENEVVEAEAAALERAGFDVRIASVHNDDLATRRLHAVRGAATVMTGIGISPLSRLNGFRPDVIHVHSLFPYFGRAWLRRPPAPVVATLHSYRSVCANGFLFRDGEVCTLCPDGRPWSGVRHACYRHSRLATVPLAWAGRRGATADPILRDARRLLVLSGRAEGVLAAAGVSPAKMNRDWHFVPDGLDPTGEGERGDAWLFVGRLTREKGIDRLVAEWPAGVPLRIIGAGNLRPSLEGAAAGKDITFLGRLPRTTVVAEMRRSFGLVFPSRWFETFGLTYMEALAAGLPTLAFPPNVVADAVEQDGTGAVAAWGEVGQALDRARLSFDGLRDRCRSLFLERYTEEAFVARRTRLYNEVRR
ncbi:glycosyltransferase [soil metagenome]